MRRRATAQLIDGGPARAFGGRIVGVLHKTDLRNSLEYSLVRRPDGPDVIWRRY